MLVELNELNYKKEIIIDQVVNKSDDLDKRILDLKESRVTGTIYLSGVDQIMVDLIFKGIMILNDSVTLDEVEYPFNIKINDNLTSIAEEFANSVDFKENTLDIFQLLWENIVLEVPISYTVSKDTKLSGNGWELKSNGEDSSECDPRLEKLKELLKGDD